jgi:hypothetical protein
MTTDHVIGEMAGTVWKILKKEGEVLLPQVAKAATAKEPLVYMALGWLAREGKLEFRAKGRQTLVALRQEHL